MSKVLLFSGTIIGRAFKTPVSPDPSAPKQSAEEIAGGAATDVILTIAPGSESMKTGEIRVHVPQLDAGSMIQNQEVDIVISPAGHMTDTIKTLSKLQQDLNDASNTVEELNASLYTAEQTAESLRSQLTTMTERAEQAEEAVQQRDTEIQQLQEKIAAFQAGGQDTATPVEATVLDDKVTPPPAIPPAPAPSTPGTGS